jgi:hypothetical protein
MPHWAWVALVIGGIVALFAFLLRMGGGEPLDRSDTGGGDYPGDSHGGDHP